MEEKLRQLLQDAFGEAAARDANVAIARARRGREPRPETDDAPGLRLYEIILTGFAPFASDLLPKLVYHLESIGAHLPECRGVLIAAFVGDSLHFVEAKAFIARACEILGVAPEELVRRHGTGERRTAVRSDPLLLPGPKGGDA
jgi:hypothetical protein